MSEATPRTSFVHCHHEPIRWGDMDAFGHVNNVQFFRYLETARVEYAMAVIAEEVRAEGQNIILADLRCAFRRQLKWPGEIDVYTRTSRVGRTSIVLDQTICVAGSNDLAANAQNVLVWFDFTTQKPASVPEPIRARIATFERVRPEGL